jgi:hypothetical protein
MQETITAFVGLDAHAESNAIGVAEAGREVPRFVGTVGPKFAELSKALSKLGDPSKLLIVYEAGPCGYALARELKRAGYRCEVVAPSKVPRRPGDRVKTDRRDALTLAGLARAGELTFVVVPDLDPLSWTPDSLYARSPIWPSQSSQSGIRRSSVDSWWSCTERDERSQSSRVNSVRRSGRSVAGCDRPIVTRVEGMAA